MITFVPAGISLSLTMTSSPMTLQINKYDFPETCYNVIKCSPRKYGDTLIQPETLLETHLDILHVGEVPGGGGPLRVLPKDVPELLLALLLDLGVTRHQVKGEGHVGRRGVMS